MLHCQHIYYQLTAKIKTMTVQIVIVQGRSDFNIK
jgi:hypothetical protein